MYNISNIFYVIFQRIPVFNPSNGSKMFWDIIHWFAMLSFFFFIPVHIAAGVSFKKLMPIEFNYVMTIIIIFDIFVNLNTGYYLKGVCINNRKLILKNYFERQFFTDFIAVFPQIITLQT
jgi:hypothetical protein